MLTSACTSSATVKMVDYDLPGTGTVVEAAGCGVEMDARGGTLPESDRVVLGDWHAGGGRGPSEEGSGSGGPGRNAVEKVSLRGARTSPLTHV